MKEKFRIIWQFEDGRRRYAINNRFPELWMQWEIDILTKRMKETQAAYTEDLKFFAVNVDDLIKLGNENCIKIAGFTIESSKETIQEDLIY